MPIGIESSGIWIAARRSPIFAGLTLGILFFIFGIVHIVWGPFEYRSRSWGAYYVASGLILPLGVWLIVAMVIRLRRHGPYLIVTEREVWCSSWSRRLVWDDVKAVEISRSVDSSFLTFVERGDGAKLGCKVPTGDCDFASLSQSLRDVSSRRSVPFYSP